MYKYNTMQTFLKIKSNRNDKNNQIIKTSNRNKNRKYVLYVARIYHSQIWTTTSMHLYLECTNNRIVYYLVHTMDYYSVNITNSLHYFSKYTLLLSTATCVLVLLVLYILLSRTCNNQHILLCNLHKNHYALLFKMYQFVLVWTAIQLALQIACINKYTLLFIYLLLFASKECDNILQVPKTESFGQTIISFEKAFKSL